tara:strand:+ start:209 stop:427 length:219 start_codon:yes stop_codon:yes gene_type:complete
MTTEVIKEAARDKAFANITTLEFQIKDTAEDIRFGRIGAITMEELLSLHKGLIKQQQLWNYIAQLIEKDDKN